MREIELKLLLDEASVKALRGRLRISALKVGEARTRLLRSTYFDTPAHALKEAGIALRMRRDGRRWVQTVKARATLHAGLSQAAEVEVPAKAGRLDIEAIPDVDIRAEVARLFGDSLPQPVCETRMRRTSQRLSVAPGCLAELAIDVGEILAAGKSAKLHEAEIELIEGPLESLFDLARELFPEGGLRFSRLPKSARGYLLAEQGIIEPPPAPREARSIPLSKDRTVEEAARAVLRECIDQIADNVVAVRQLDDPEGPHQLRVGLRRLRSALSLFGSALASPGSDAIGAEARWLGQEVGVLRDLDVAVNDMLRPEAEANPSESGLAALADGFARRTGTQRQKLRGLVAGRRVQAFLIDLVRFAETRGWLNPDDIGQTARLAEPISDFAGAALQKRRKKVASGAKDLETLAPDERHELRKQLKKLRYAVEFLAPLYPAKRARPFLKRLKQLQAIFGDVNDAEMLQRLLDDLAPEPAADSMAPRAIGWAIGASRAHAEFGWRSVGPAWRELKKTRAFWR